jgi:hypothetical protein
MSGAPAILVKRCDPYGRESGGPRRLQGGMYGPEYEGNYKWGCERPSSGRYRMICRCGHKGQPMELCGAGFVKDAQGQTMPHTGHIAEFQKRASDLCPVCVYPPEARALTVTAEIAQSELSSPLIIPGSPQWRMLGRKVEDARTRLDELNASGRIHKCHLTLTEIS